jgi:hypothetical protein
VPCGRDSEGNFVYHLTFKSRADETAARDEWINADESIVGISRMPPADIEYIREPIKDSQ